jgi:hypothetical protein
MVSETTTPKALPSDAELRRLTTDTLLAFDQALQAQDFTAFHASIAELWKRQTTPEQFAEAFQAFLVKKVAIGGVKDIAPVFAAPPVINEQGFLVVSGYMPTVPLLVQFTLKYTYEHPMWKLISIRINIQDMEE